MDDVCRLCLDSQSYKTSIFLEDDNIQMLSSKISDCCSVEVFKNDALPKLICVKCESMVKSIYEFRKLCKVSDLKLREYYNIASTNTAPSIKQMTSKDASVQTDITMISHEKVNDLKYSWLRKKKQIAEQNVKTVQTLTADHNFEEWKAEVFPDNYCAENNKNHGYNLQLSSFEVNSAPERQNTITECTPEAKNINRESKGVKTRKKFICNTCKQTFLSEKMLLKHTKSHIPKNDLLHLSLSKTRKTSSCIDKHNATSKLNCKVCNMPFTKKDKLISHLRIHNKVLEIKTDKQYLCDVCSRTFASKSGLRFHLKSHNGLKPHTCKYCNKSFAIPSYKKRHERIHTGIKQFVCHVCSAAFASSNGLTYHLRGHTGEANYRCETCGKSFRRDKYLKEHIFTHTGEKPFACKICGSAYGSSGSLFVHEKKCKMQYLPFNNTNIVKEERT